MRFLRLALRCERHLNYPFKPCVLIWSPRVLWGHARLASVQQEVPPPPLPPPFVLMKPLGSSGKPWNWTRSISFQTTTDAASSSVPLRFKNQTLLGSVLKPRPSVPSPRQPQTGRGSCRREEASRWFNQMLKNIQPSTVFILPTLRLCVDLNAVIHRQRRRSLLLFMYVCILVLYQ